MVMDAINVLLSFPVAFLVTVVNTFRNLMECIELCIWILKSEYPPVGMYACLVFSLKITFLDSKFLLVISNY